MSNHDQTNPEAHTPLQRPPAWTEISTMLISLCFGLPIVSAAIFGAGLWLGHEWYSPPSWPPLCPRMRPGLQIVNP